MGPESPSRFMSFRTSLRVRVALGVALPLLLVLSSLSLMRYQRERRLLDDQMRLTVVQLSDLMVGSLRHSMASNDRAMFAQILRDMGKIETVQRVQVIGLDGRVMADSLDEQLGTIRGLGDPGCVECHRFPAESIPRTTRFSTAAGVLRISKPIPIEPDCMGCHTAPGAHLGVLLADLSVVATEDRLRHNLRVDLAISAGSTVLVTLGMYLLVHWLVVRRVEAFRRPLAEYAAGNFASRLPVSPRPTDELGELANTLSRMADQLDRHAHEQEERSRVRQRAIVEERERIARELHDGLAQLLGYINTKAMAVRLMLKNRKLEAADQHLLQLEEAARGLFVDVREAILGLKMAGQTGTDLTVALREYTAQFSRLSSLPVELALAPGIDDLALSTETELQLLRIVQESLTNVRRHAWATKAWVSLQIDEGVLCMTIGDNGNGFDPDAVWADHRPRFGLSAMHERAEAIGAKFDVDPGTGTGTRVTVRVGAANGAPAQLKAE